MILPKCALQKNIWRIIGTVVSIGLQKYVRGSQFSLSFTLEKNNPFSEQMVSVDKYSSILTIVYRWLLIVNTVWLNNYKTLYIWAPLLNLLSGKTEGKKTLLWFFAIVLIVHSNLILSFDTCSIGKVYDLVYVQSFELKRFWLNVKTTVDYRSYLWCNCKVYMYACVLFFCKRYCTVIKGNCE